MGEISKSGMARFLVVGLVCFIVACSNAMEDGVEAQAKAELAAELQEHGHCDSEVKMAKSKCSAKSAQLKEVILSSCGRRT